MGPSDTPKPVSSHLGGQPRIRVGAAVVTYRREEGVARTVEALLRQDFPVDQILVVDNGSDGVAARLWSQSQSVVVIETGGNLGAAGGFEVALNEAARRGLDWLLLLNDDDTPLPNALSTLMERVESEPHRSTLAAVGGWVSTGGVVRPAGAHFRRGIVYLSQAEIRAPEYTVDICTFNSLLVSVSAVQAVGGLRDDFFMMWEEYELCLRLRRSGRRIVIVSATVVERGGSHGGEVYAPWRGYYEARNGLITIRTHRLWGALPWFLIRESKFAAAAVRLPKASQRIRLRALGVWHGWRWVGGRTIEPS
jgi:GT2 family glycosyltransferase